MRLIIFLLLLYLLIRLGYHIFGEPKTAPPDYPWMDMIRWDHVAEKFIAAKEFHGTVNATISQQTGVSVDTLRRLEKGQACDLEVIGKVALALNVEPDWLLDLSKNPFQSLLLEGIDQKLYPNGLPEIYDDYYDDDE